MIIASPKKVLLLVSLSMSDLNSFGQVVISYETPLLRPRTTQLWSLWCHQKSYRFLYLENQKSCAIQSCKYHATFAFFSENQDYDLLRWYFDEPSLGLVGRKWLHLWLLVIFVAKGEKFNNFQFFHQIQWATEQDHSGRIGKPRHLIFIHLGQVPKVHTNYVSPFSKYHNGLGK